MYLATNLLLVQLTGDKFFDYVRGQLIPSMHPFPGDQSILVMDNCTVHHTEQLIDLAQNAGILLLFLPPYSPDFNPVEELFSYVKYYLKQHDEVIQALENITPILQSAFDSVTTSQCNGWITQDIRTVITHNIVSVFVLMKITVFLYLGVWFLAFLCIPQQL